MDAALAGERSQGVARATRFLARLEYARGNFEASHRLARDAAELFVENLTVDHPLALGMMMDYAMTLTELGRATEARQIYEYALSSFAFAQGAEHADTLRAKELLQELSHHQSRG